MYPRKIIYKGEPFHKDLFDKYVSETNGKSLFEILRSGGFELKREMMQSLSSVVSFKESKVDEDYWMQMTTQDIKELSACEFCTIGSHSYYHNDLTAIDIGDAVKEMIRSKHYLEDIINKPVPSLAFPYGAYSNALKEEAKKAGFNKLLALDFYFKEDYSDSSMRERLTINPYISVTNQMHAIIRGGYE